MNVNKERLLEILNEVLDNASIATSPEDPCSGLTQEQIAAIRMAIDVIESEWDYYCEDCSDVEDEE